MTRLIPLLIALPGTALAEPYTRPTPLAQDATAELWYAAASIALVLTLVAVNWLVHRK